MKRRIPSGTRQLCIVCFVFLIVLVSVSCSPVFAMNSTPTVVPTSTPEKLELINGELDACQLVNLTEIESLVGMKVNPKRSFAESGWWCFYYPVSGDSGALFGITVFTDATIKRANQFFHRKFNSTELDSATDVYDGRKMVSQRMAQEISDYKMEEIEDLGDQAFSTELSFLTIHILNNGILYEFSTFMNNGISKDTLMKLVNIALPRMP
jgi:hypothetical protein